MDQKQAFEMFEQYLKSHNLPHVLGTEPLDDGARAPLVTMVFPAELCPGGVVEGCVWFYPEGMEARVYYSEAGAEFCRESPHRPELYRLLNFINARVFPRAADGFGNRLYQPHGLFTPRFYLTEDDQFDITMTTAIDYDVFGLAPLETADYLTMFCPSLLKQLSRPIFFLLLGEWTVEESIVAITANA